MVYDTYLLIQNPAKSNCLGPILRCAAAFAVHTVIFVGYEQCSTEGSHGAASHVRIIAFPTLCQAETYLRNSCGVVTLIGLLGAKGGEGAYQSDGCKVMQNEKDEMVILDDRCLGDTKNEKEINNQYPFSLPIHIRPFTSGNICFSISKFWTGLPIDQARSCDSFIHIPVVSIPPIDVVNGFTNQYSRLLDPQSCLSIALHHYTAWANYGTLERDIQGQKYAVTKGHNKFEKGTEAQINYANLRSEARGKMNEAVEDVFDEGGLGGLFADN